MNKVLFVLLFIVFAAYGQQQERVAIINTMDNLDSINFSDLAHLTNRLRETAVKVLPKSRYGVMTTESIVAFLGSGEQAAKICNEASCLAEIGRKVNADYVAQGRIGRFNGELTINFELYNSRSGNLIGSFTGSNSKITGLLAVIDEKAPDLFREMPGVGRYSPSIAGGISGVEKNKDYELDYKRRYLINLSTEPAGAVLSFDGVPIASCSKTPCKAELPEGNVRIAAALEQYETADTTVYIVSNNQSIAVALKPNFGVLEIKPAYLDGIGVNKGWSFTVNGKEQFSFENRFSPGNYEVKLSNECYEDVSFKVGINKNKREIFDMANNITLKKGGLDLSAEKDGEPVSEPVFVNGSQVGETPFVGSVPLCGEIRIGSGKNKVDVEIAYNQIVKHKYQITGSVSDDLMNRKEKFMDKLAARRNGTNLSEYHFNDWQKEYVSKPTLQEPEKQIKTSFWVALGLDVLGVAFISAGYVKNQEMLNAYDKYSEINSGGNHRDAWESVESERNSRNMLYIIGGIFLASGIGVHIWF